jgi:DNA-binding response OmpR family regulator
MTAFGSLAVLKQTMPPLDARDMGPAVIRGKVLVIEDEAVTALDMSNDLESWSYDVIGVVRSMDQALRAAEQDRPHIAIVDVMLRDAHDGIQIAEILKERFGTQIVFLTAHSDQATRARVVKVGPLGYLYKPYSAYALRQLLETHSSG